MARAQFLLRASDPHRPLWWSRTGWQPDRAAAERFETRRRAEIARADLDTDRDVCVYVVRGARKAAKA